MRSFENPSRSHDWDMGKDPEGIYGRDDKTDDEKPKTFEEHMRELRGNLPMDENERVKEILRKMDEVGSFGRQIRNLTDEERKERIERAREKVLRSFRKSSDNGDNGPVDHDVVDVPQMDNGDNGLVNHDVLDDSRIDSSPVVDEEDKPQIDYIPLTDFPKKEPINMHSLEPEEPVSSMEIASPEDEADYHEFRAEQILGQFFPKAANNERIVNEGHPEQEQIEQLKTQLSNCDNQIKELLSSMQPYMQIPKVNREISKVIEKNNEINLSRTVENINDFKEAVEAKQSLVAYLEQANRFIKDNIEKNQKPVVGRQKLESPTDMLNDPNIWGWLNEEGKHDV